MRKPIPISLRLVVKKGIEYPQQNFWLDIIAGISDHNLYPSILLGWNSQHDFARPILRSGRRRH
jgi:hypothetical protein